MAHGRNLGTNKCVTTTKLEGIRLNWLHHTHPIVYYVNTAIDQFNIGNTDAIVNYPSPTLELQSILGRQQQLFNVLIELALYTIMPHDF